MSGVFPQLRPGSRPRLVFTDLDGSLLDHHSYDWSSARPWLGALKEAGVAVIPVTSKTRSELMPLRQALGLSHTPFIAENGGVVALPPAWCHAKREAVPGADGLVVKNLAVDIGLIRQRVMVWRERLGADFITMSEMSVSEVSAWTGLDEQSARLARLREGSEPLVWRDTEDRLTRFAEGLAGDGLHMTRGGRFWHVTGDIDKGRAVSWLCSRFEALRGTVPETLALGDGPNDIAMLEVVEAAVIIRGQHGLDIVLGQAGSGFPPRLYRTQASGPEGWAEGLSYFWGEEGKA